MANDIVVLGELNVDVILTGDDVTPVFGQVEKLVDDATLTLGSSSAIFACGAARLGLQVAFVGKVGNDDLGRFVLRALQERGVDVSPVIVDAKIKTGLTVHLSSRHDRAMLTYPGSIAALRADDVDHRLLQQTRCVHVGSFFLQTGLQPGLSELLAAARAEGAITSLDPGWDPHQRWDRTLGRTLDHVDLLLPNQQEAMAITGAVNLETAIERLSHRVPLVAVKLGSEGGIARSHSQQARCAGFSVNAVDTTGAGDSFDAGFLFGRLRGLTLDECLRWGCACGALATTRTGGIAGQPAVDEVEDLFASHGMHAEGS